MKALKTSIITFLLLQTVVSFGQTKEETEQWINEKMKSYEGKINSKEDTDEFYDFSLRDGKLSVTIIHTDYYRKGGVMFKKERIVNNVSINKLEIYGKDVTFPDKGKFSFVFKLRSNASYDILCKDFEDEEGTTESKQCEDKITLWLRLGEENIGERLEKAFVHYATFFPEKKETF